MRTLSSCSTCRSRKKKCVPSEVSLSKCTLCNTKGLSCDLSAVSRDPSKDTAQQQHNIDSEQLDSIAGPANAFTPSRPYDEQQHDLLPDTVRTSLIERYFDIIHDKQHVCFDHRIFIQEKQDGLVPEYVLLGMMAVVARFCSDPFYTGLHPHDRAAPLLKRGLKLFNDREDVISVHALQGAIVLAFACFVEGHADQDALLAAQAVRMVQVMDLPNELDKNPERRQLMIRLFWQTLMMDTWNSARNNLPRQLTAPQSMPRPHDDWTELLRDTAVDHQERGHSIWAQIVSLNETFAEICQLNEVIVSQPSQRFLMDHRVRNLTERLDHWLHGLPHTLHNNDANYLEHSKIGRGRLLAVLHLIYHYQSQLLYFSYLGTARPDMSAHTYDRTTADYILRCKAHSEALSKLMWKVNTTPGMECLWSPVNGHLLVVASTIHLFSLLSERDEHRGAQMRTLMEQNFVMLQQFQRYWPGLRESFGRLRDLHRYCGAAEDLTCFAMDTWMWNFLSRYDGKLPPRPGVTMPTSGSLEFTGEDLASHSSLRSSLTFK